MLFLLYHIQALDNKVQDIEFIKQGLPIGNSTEGFLVNVYLKKIDESMATHKIEFGRYNDDMRIFSNNKQHVLNAVLILQQLLLTKGLNLNAGKTMIAENEEQIENLRAKAYDIYDYFISEDEGENILSNLIEHIDSGFDEFDIIFKEDDEILITKLQKISVNI